MRNLSLLACALLVACSIEEIPGTRVAFDLDADLTSMEHFFDLPWPMDERLKDGRPDLGGFPNHRANKAVAQLLSIADARDGYPVNAAAFFRFTAPLKPRSHEELIPAAKTSPILLVDLTDGKLHPVVASTLVEDDYVPEHLLAVGPRPGVVLSPNRKYAYVVLRAAQDEAGQPLGVPLAMRQLLEGETPEGARGAAVAASYQPLVGALKKAGVEADEVAAAAVFTTGDVVGALHALTEKVRQAHTATISDLKPDPDGGEHPGFCELRGLVKQPQFQQGPPPWDTDGTFAFDATGELIVQREEQVPVTITLPKGEMPEGGWPLMLYFHGSGGDSREAVDAGPKDTPDGERRPDEGPASVVGPLGLAVATTALPISPERVPGASSFAYLNLNNFAAFPYLFQQGVIEQRLYLDALLKLEIPASTVDGCTGMSLPAGETAHRFDPAKVVALGLSMGGMYTNMVGAVEPRIRAVAPTGAGGYWGYFILTTKMLPGATMISALLGASTEINFLHPTLQLAQTAWEAAEPMVFTPRLARRPLSGHPVRPIYQPVGQEDSYFPEPLLDAMALSYGNQQASESVWPGLQQTLALEGRDGLATYPVTDNRKSEDGTAYTGVVVPWAFDGFNGHHVVFQLDEVKRQYGCFFTSFLDTGKATVVAPDGQGACR